jgi:U4/U6 small nuclear ribonucleoprotein PRP31
MSLADAFLADLDEELAQNDERSSSEQDVRSDAEENNAQSEDEDVEMRVDAKSVRSKGAGDIAPLLNSERARALLGKIERERDRAPQQIVGAVEDHPDYKTVLEGNELALSLHSEFMRLYKFLKHLYKPRFPELESLLLIPLEYVRAVDRIGNASDIAAVQLADILPPAQLMVVSVTAATTAGTMLDDATSARVSEGCALALAIEHARQSIVDFVAQRMRFIAPNLTIIVGSNVAAKLMALAGGLTALSRMTANTIKAIGAKRHALIGLSAQAHDTHVGVISECDLIQKAPPSLRIRAVRVVSGKCALAARVDCFHDAETEKAATGNSLREFIERSIERMQEPPPAKQAKPLAVPDEKPRKKRGGRRYRKVKERYAVTDVRKAQNRMNFGVDEQDSLLAGDTVKDLGMIGKSSGSVLLRAQEKGILKKYKQKSFSTGGTTSGLSSSLAFTPIQGIELENPLAAAARQSDANAKYFGTASTFAHLSK